MQGEAQMMKLRITVMTALLCLVLGMTGCGGKEDKEAEKTADGSTSDLVAAENEDTDEEMDSSGEEKETGPEAPSEDLMVRGRDIYTQFIHLTVPEEWTENVIYHYFQEPENGRYALDIVEFNTMSATEGEGGLAYSIVLYEGYSEEKGMDPPGRFLGLLKSDEGKYYYAFLEFPGESRYTQSSEEAYRSILDYEDKIPLNIEGRETYTFTAGEKPAADETEETKE